MDEPNVRPRGLVIADFDNDGHNDAAVASELIDLVVVLFNDGMGGFGQQVPVPLMLGFERRPYDIVVGDFQVSEDYPVLLDLVTANLLDDSISVIRNDGNRNFTAIRRERPPGCLTPSWEFEGIAVGRFDLGVFDDVAGTGELDDFANVFLGDGQTNFAHDCTQAMRDRYQLHPLFNTALCWGVDAGHLNGGTKQDLATVLQFTREVSVLLGIGDGTFQRPAPNSGYLYSVEPPDDPPNEALNPIQVKIVDLNQDGFGDLVTSNWDSDNISVLINKMLVVGGPGGGL